MRSSLCEFCTASDKRMQAWEQSFCIYIALIQLLTGSVEKIDAYRTARIAYPDAGD